MEEYKTNSHSAKRIQEEERNKLEPVTSVPAKVKKKGEARKFLDLFVADEKEDIKSYIFLDVLIPSIKKAIWDIFAGGLEMTLFGNRGSSPRSSNRASKVSYTKYYDDRDRVSQRETRPRLAYDYDDLIFDNRGTAEEVLSRLDELVDTYGFATVADFYDLAGVSGSYTNNNYGWTDIRNASVVRVRDGYVIKFPKALPTT